MQQQMEMMLDAPAQCSQVGPDQCWVTGAQGGLPTFVNTSSCFLPGDVAEWGLVKLGLTNSSHSQYSCLDGRSRMDGGMSQNTKAGEQTTSAGATRELLGLESKLPQDLPFYRPGFSFLCELATLSREYLKFFLCRLQELIDISRSMKSRLKFTPAVIVKALRYCSFYQILHVCKRL